MDVTKETVVLHQLALRRRRRTNARQLSNLVTVAHVTLLTQLIKPNYPYNEVISVTKGTLRPSNSKTYGKEPRYNEIPF